MEVKRAIEKESTLKVSYVASREIMGKKYEFLQDLYISLGITQTKDHYA